MSLVRIDASSAACLVFTEAEGALGGLGHDLAIRVTRFALDVDTSARTVRGTFDAGSLIVEAAVRDGQLDPGALSAKDKAEIERNIRREVLHSERYPDVVLAGSYEPDDDGTVRFEGALTLHGTQRPLRAFSVTTDNLHTVEVRLHQPDFGIKPYRALLGALKVRADVKVTLAFPGFS